VPKPGVHEPKDEAIQEEVSAELGEAQLFARTLDFEEVKSGEWFFSLLQKVVRAYDRNARAEYFRKKYPGLAPDEIADILTSVTVRYAAIAGALTGTAATTSQLATLGSAGMTASLFVGSIGAEMLYLARIQMRLILDLSVVYDLQLNPEDPEDVLMILGYALGVAPTDMLGTGAIVVAREGTTRIIKRYVSGATLEAIQRFAARLGIKILQRTIIKYTVPPWSLPPWAAPTTTQLPWRWARSPRRISRTEAGWTKNCVASSLAATPTTWRSLPRSCTWARSMGNPHCLNASFTEPCSPGCRSPSTHQMTFDAS